MANIKDTLVVHTTEDSILSAMRTVMQAEMQRTANEIIQKAMQDMASALQDRAMEIIARSVVKIASEVNPMSREVKLNISVTIPMGY